MKEKIGLNGKTKMKEKIYENIARNSSCTGCMVCKSVCKMGAIENIEGELGFVYPVINKKKCINCQKCINICPANNNIKSHLLKNNICFACQAKDDIRMKSSSGGVFWVVANKVIENGGAVCAAKYNKDRVEHVIIDDGEQLLALCKSKYIQSDVEGIYGKIADAGRKYRMILFVGTPCQCAAINKRFKNFDKLFTIDILCMGVPSQKTFLRYLSEEKISNATNFDFRDKNIEGWSQNLFFTYSIKDKNFHVNNGESTYYTAFLNGLSIRDSCTECIYAGEERQGDITLGDFWGIESYDKKLDDKKGTSLVLINNDKGQLLIEKCKQELKVFEKLPIDLAVAGNSILRTPSGNSFAREQFKKNYEEKSIKNNLQDCLAMNEECGIINYWNSDDNGAILTAYALQKSLDKMGISSRLINIGCMQNRKGNGISRRFECRYLKTTLPIYEEKIGELNRYFETFLVGSDQVFRKEWVPYNFFLDFADKEKKKIAVAASFGTDNICVSDREKRKMTYYLKRFNALSVREKSGRKLLKLLGVKGIQIIDPVFWISKDEYISFFNLKMDKSNRVVAYFRDVSVEKRKLCNEIAQKYNSDIFYINDETEVEIFLCSIMNAVYVVTDSYHGLCFSIIFNKRYLCIYNTLRGNSRFDSLIELLKLPRDCFVNEHEMDNLNNVQTIEKWKGINEEIIKESVRAKKWLYQKIKGPNNTWKTHVEAGVYEKWCNCKDTIFWKRSYLKREFALHPPTLVCYGAGYIGEKACEILPEVDFFIDNNSQIKIIEKHPVFTWRIAKKFINKNTTIVVSTTSKYSDEIIRSLECEGYLQCYKFEDYVKEKCIEKT